MEHKASCWFLTSITYLWISEMHQLWAIIDFRNACSKNISKSSIWNVRFQTNRTISSIWNVRFQTNQTISSIWNVRFQTYRTMLSIWNVRFQTNHKQQSIWNSWFQTNRCGMIMNYTKSDRLDYHTLIIIYAITLSW